MRTVHCDNDDFIDLQKGESFDVKGLKPFTLTQTITLLEVIETITNKTKTLRKSGSNDPATFTLTQEIIVGAPKKKSYALGPLFRIKQLITYTDKVSMKEELVIAEINV